MDYDDDELDNFDFEAFDMGRHVDRAPEPIEDIINITIVPNKFGGWLKINHLFLFLHGISPEDLSTAAKMSVEAIYLDTFDAQDVVQKIKNDRYDCTEFHVTECDEDLDAINALPNNTEGYTRTLN